MPTPPTLILGSGGIRSLVATAMLLSRTEPPRLVPLHFRDDSARGNICREYVRRQAEHFKLKGVLELDVAKLNHATAPSSTSGPPAKAPLFQARTLLSSLAQAAAIGATHVVWPGQFKGDFDRVSRAAEMIVLAQHLAQLELPSVPQIETPLLELDDAEVIELGQQLQVPWTLAWSCDHGGDQPCGACHGCRSRKSAFESAGAVDPINKLMNRGTR
jgi:7-cyano-7-deazaguanine synthase in queuosine biosynthesis